MPPLPSPIDRPSFVLVHLALVQVPPSFRPSQVAPPEAAPGPAVPVSPLVSLLPPYLTPSAAPLKPTDRTSPLPSQHSDCHILHCCFVTGDCPKVAQSTTCCARRAQQKSHPINRGQGAETCFFARRCLKKQARGVIRSWASAGTSCQTSSRRSRLLKHIAHRAQRASRHGRCSVWLNRAPAGHSLDRACDHYLSIWKVLQSHR